MRKTTQILTVLLLTVLISLTLCAPAFALDESEVEAAVSASSKEAVAGNVLIWFLCAVAFLKVSQKIDSFMASLGVNVGHTGGSMLSEAMIAMRAVTTIAGGGHRAGAGRSGSAAGSSNGKSGASGLTGFFKGGLIGMAGRHVTNSAVKTATSQTAAIHTAHKQAGATVHTETEKQSASEARTSSIVQSDGIVHTDSISRTDSQARADSVVRQDGVIDTGHTPAPAASFQTGSVAPSGSAPLSGNAPTASTPLDEGIIITGNNTPPVPPTQADSISAPESSIHPDPAAPQEGPVLTSSEVQSSSETQSSTVVQTQGQTDSVLQQEGIIQTGSEHISHSSSEKVHSDTIRQGGGESGGRSEHHTVNQTRSVENTQHSTHSVFPVHVPTLGGKIFSNSLQSGGRFANDVIGMVARGDMRSTGSITGDLAAQSLQSYMGHIALGASASERVTYSQVEIGGGRIIGREVTPEHPQGIEFAMYHVDQYTRPEGDFQKIFSADGAQWYKQHAVDTVVKTPFKAPDGEIDYQKEIVKRLPTPPKRKDRM